MSTDASVCPALTNTPPSFEIIGKIDDLIAYRLKIEKLIKFKKSEKIYIRNQNYQSIKY